MTKFLEKAHTAVRDLTSTFDLQNNRLIDPEILVWTNADPFKHVLYPNLLWKQIITIATIDQMSILAKNKIYIKPIKAFNGGEKFQDYAWSYIKHQSGYSHHDIHLSSLNQRLPALLISVL